MSQQANAYRYTRGRCGSPVATRNYRNQFQGLRPNRDGGGGPPPRDPQTDYVSQFQELRPNRVMGFADAELTEIQMTTRVADRRARMRERGMDGFRWYDDWHICLCDHCWSYYHDKAACPWGHIRSKTVARQRSGFIVLKNEPQVLAKSIFYRPGGQDRASSNRQGVERLDRFLEMSKTIYRGEWDYWYIRQDTEADGGGAPDNNYGNVHNAEATGRNNNNMAAAQPNNSANHQKRNSDGLPWDRWFGRRRSGGRYSSQNGRGVSNDGSRYKSNGGGSNYHQRRYPQENKEQASKSGGGAGTISFL